MMQLTHDNHDTDFVIKSYKPSQLVINDTLYEQSMIVTPHALDVWPPKDFSQLTAEHIEQLLLFSPEIVLIGTGAHQKFPDTKILLPLIQKNIGFEIMSTLAACYTFKVLAAEGRAVVAGLIV